MPVKIKAVLFDMDGVLVEAKDWHYEALNRALDVFGLPISRSEHLSQYDGLPTRTKHQDAHGKEGFAAGIAQVFKRLEAALHHRHHHNALPSGL